MWSITVSDERTSSTEASIVIPSERLIAALRIVLEHERVPTNMAVELHYLDSDAMHALNKEHMDADYATDVLAFPLDTPTDAADNPDVDYMLGDIVLCPVVAKRQADQAGHSLQDEVELLTVHGCLHLLGYDHYEEEEKREMFALTDKLLAQLRSF